METNPKYFFVGISLVLLFLLTAGGFIWLTKVGKDRDQSTFISYFRNNSLDGLQEGSIVTMRGIPVGSVKSLEFVEQDIERVKVLLSLKRSIPVKTDTRTVVQRNLLTGQAWIDLKNSTQAAPLLSALPLEEDFPIIKEDKGTVETIKDKLPEILNKAENVLNGLNSMLSINNQKSIEQTISNLNSITSELTHDGKKPAEAILEFTKLMQEINNAVKTVNNLSRNIKQQIEPILIHFSRSLDSVSGNVNTSTKQFSDTLKSFQNPREILTGPASSNLGPGENN